ncbi:hypothetical protein CYLTODRAFT_386678 [Cylindrobasidium torrendii FP15055 ss-10]|uniref:YABBY protein C-terminal domain-containing protein n=1 Tax=Cylindrobasidium torrendii FP15055 ss-10 TaxID=1314674 RepID=A0A0D7BTN0_9AGAR|nr:hypothetical protein CYLTODRAFT_386678 [Cylindrobasidium torrendii FP15055 ss-10]
MATATTKHSTEKPEKKTTSGGKKGNRRLTPFNKFMQTELARLKEAEPDKTHQQRFKLATGNWKTSPMNPKAAT